MKNCHRGLWTGSHLSLSELSEREADGCKLSEKQEVALNKVICVLRCRQLVRY